jgi:hypothetical protein
MILLLRAGYLPLVLVLGRLLRFRMQNRDKLNRKQAEEFIVKHHQNAVQNFAEQSDLARREEGS